MSSRIWCLLGGLAALGVAWLGPLPTISHRAFFGHMTMHMLNVAIAAPLLSLAIAGSRCDPTRGCPWLFAIIPASVIELIVVWGWHAPVPHHFARHATLGLILEQGTFLLSGLWVWLSAFGRSADHALPRRQAAGVIGLFLTSMHMTLLGALLALAPRELYGHQHGFAGMTPLQDQHLGGAIMLVVGGVAYLAGGLKLSMELVRPDRNPSSALESTRHSTDGYL